MNLIKNLIKQNPPSFDKLRTAGFVFVIQSAIVLEDVFLNLT